MYELENALRMVEMTIVNATGNNGHIQEGFRMKSKLIAAKSYSI